MATSPRIDDLQKKFTENPRRYFAPLANEYRKAGDLAQAIAICRQHLADQPGHMSGHIVYGQALFENHEHEEAQKVFTAALALDPENLIALRLLGDIARDGGDYEAAHGWYQRVLDADPRNEDIQAQLKLVQEAEERAAAEATREPVSATIESEAVPRTLAPTPAAGTPTLDETTVEIKRVTPPWAKPEPVPLTPMNEEDVAPPRLSIMGLDLESMARIADPDNTPTLVPRTQPPASEFETSVPFNSAQFDGEIEVDTNPLAGVSGIETKDETSAASLAASANAVPTADGEFKITPPFGSAEQPAPAADLPPELHMPMRVTPPSMELGLAPQPKPEPTGLWDTLEEMEAEGAAALETSAPRRTPPNFEPPTLLFEAPADSAATSAHAEVASTEAFELVESASATVPAPGTEPFVTETMADLYVQQGLAAEALTVYRQLLATRPADEGLLGKIAQLEALASTSHTAPSVRDFFAALANWRPGQVAMAAAMMATHEPLAAQEAEAAPAHTEAPVSVAPDVEPWMTGRPYDLGVFTGASIRDADEMAGRRLAAMYPDSGPMSMAPAAVMEAPVAAPTPIDVLELPGQPARPASRELSLDQVFSEPPPQRPSRKSASFSFDQFFSQTAQVPAVPRSPTPGATPAQPSPEEAEQFQNWLKGLKGP